MINFSLTNFASIYIQIGFLKGLKARLTSNRRSINFWYTFQHKLHGYVDFNLIYRYLLLAALMWLNIFQKFTCKFLLLVDPGLYTLLNNGYNSQTILAEGGISGGLSNHLSINPTLEMGLSTNTKNYKYFNYDLIGIFSSTFWISGNGGLNGEMLKKFKGLITSTLNSVDSNSWSKMDLFLTPTTKLFNFSFFYWKFFNYLIYFQQIKYSRFNVFANVLESFLQKTKNHINYLYEKNIKPPYKTKDYYIQNRDKFILQAKYKAYQLKHYKLQRTRLIKFNKLHPYLHSITNNVNLSKKKYVQKYSFLKVKRLTQKYSKYTSFINWETF